MINFTPLAKIFMCGPVKTARSWACDTEKVQRAQLHRLIQRGQSTEYGRRHMAGVTDYESFARQVPIADYESFRPYVMRMVSGESDVLWPGVCRRFAQSSGTSGGKSKYIPITDESLRLNHYAGPRYAVAHYLHSHPHSRLFGGKSLILGGSYANELDLPAGVKVGDLSATLIDCVPSVIEHFRVPAKDVALMEVWQKKLPALISAAIKEDITNISGVPSWFLTVLKGVLAQAGASSIHDVWPNLEVFFHGGISFRPYAAEYERITTPGKMSYVETYNASEGFFAVQDCPSDHAMLLLVGCGVFYEFIPLSDIDSPAPRIIPAWEVQPGETYAMVITAGNGLWRYAIGDTVRVESINPVRITIAGRTKSYINVFGEELMVYDAERALERACAITGCNVANFTAGPVYTLESKKGRHEWWIEWDTPPQDIAHFASVLDQCLREENSDYQAKRTGDIFLDPPLVLTAPKGIFDLWLSTTGKLGGQRKIPRLANDRHILDSLQELMDNHNCGHTR